MSILPNSRIIIVPPRFITLIVTFSSRAGYYLFAKFTSIETSVTCFSPPLSLSPPMETYALYRIDVICARPIGLVQAWIQYAANCGSGSGAGGAGLVDELIQTLVALLYRCPVSVPLVV